MAPTFKSYGIADLDCPDLKTNLEISVKWECGTGSTLEKAVN
jgi:hypothetical protein